MWCFIVLLLLSQTTADKGELLVALCYNNHLERLTVGVLEARDLKYDNQPSGKSDPPSGKSDQPSGKYHQSCGKSD